MYNQNKFYIIFHFNVINNRKFSGLLTQFCTKFEISIYITFFKHYALFLLDESFCFVVAQNLFFKKEILFALHTNQSDRRVVLETPAQ